MKSSAIRAANLLSESKCPKNIFFFEQMENRRGDTIIFLPDNVTPPALAEAEKCREYTIDHLREIA